MKLLKRKSIKDLLPFPVSASHQEYSTILSAHDETSKPTSSLISISLKAIEHAMKIDFTNICKRLDKEPYYPNIWPGEHYKLLAGFIKALNPKTVIEIGTATGLSALCLKQEMSKDSKIYTYDIFSWKDDPSTHLTNDDFLDNRLIQYVEDLSNIETFNKHKTLLENSDLIFIDATHDGQLEKKLLDLLKTCSFKNRLYIIFDDIRVWTMIKMWREIFYPKLDLTSFGHWSGTGIVELN